MSGRARRWRNALGDAALFVPTDVTDEASVKAAVAATEQHFGKLDILFNCAGGSVSADAPLGKVDVAAVWVKTMQLDLLGTIHCCHHAHPGDRARRRRGGDQHVVGCGAARREPGAYLFGREGRHPVADARARRHLREGERAGERDLRRPHPDRAHPRALRHAGRSPSRRRTSRPTSA